MVRNCEWSLATAVDPGQQQMTNEDLYPTTSRNWYLPTSAWTWKRPSSSKKEHTPTSTVISTLPELADPEHSAHINDRQRAARETQTLRTRLMDTAMVERRRGWEVWRKCMETYISICKIDSQWEFAVWLRELKPGLCNNLEEVRWGGRWEGGSKGRGNMNTYGWFVLVFGRNQYNSVKQLSFN